MTNTRISKLLQKNKNWSAKVEGKKPGFFNEQGQREGCRYLWFGCSDARVPATQLMGLGPGDVFVHRNIANQVNHEDVSSMVVLKVAVEMQKVSDIIVCGHSKCLGVLTALQKPEDPLLGKWLQPLVDLYDRKKQQLDQFSVEKKQEELMRLNVEQQVKQIARNAVVQKAWDDGRDLAIHGLVYHVEKGELEDLQISVFNEKLNSE
ncbi:carbonic anhydrase [Marinicella sp. W31]|uniref:carbonic anhydrase n=1 Tax=Marinicella sp. W31 TaxID=3023713 RepID=UPI0037571B19